MSYCRWSSDRFQCDVYCYEDVFLGYTIHVASRRIVLDGTEPVQVAFDPKNLDKFMKYENAFSEWMDKANRVNINLPHDGESFNYVYEINLSGMTIAVIGYQEKEWLISTYKPIFLVVGLWKTKI